MSGWLSNGFPLASLPFTGNERFIVDTQLSSGAQPETEAVTLSQLSAYASGAPSWVTGRFYGFPLGSTLASALTVTGTLYAYPIFVPSTVTVKSLNLSVATGQTGGAAHIGIYADNGAGYPGALVSGTDVAAVAATATAVVSTTPNVLLNPGVYWVASIYTATTTFPSVIALSSTYTADTANQIGYDTAAHALATSGQAGTGISVAATYGTLPVTFPAGATLTLNASTPAVAVGV